MSREPVNEVCEECGEVDDLGRHAATCKRARTLGLPFLAEGEEPILDSPVKDEEEPAPPERPAAAPEGARQATSEEVVAQVRKSTRGGAPCVGCGQPHANPDRSRKLGAFFVAEECEWMMRWPAQRAWEVIEHLEAKVAALEAGE